MRTAVPVLVTALGVLFAVDAALGQSSDNIIVFKEEGQASYYGGSFHGRTTASGARFDQNAMTAAHPKLPLGSEVTVIDQATGRQVEVEVSDRGPYAKRKGYRPFEGRGETRHYTKGCGQRHDRGHQAAGGGGDRATEGRAQRGAAA